MGRFSGSVLVISYGHRNPLIDIELANLLSCRDGHCWPPTGWAEAVTCLRLPQNVACRFPALRSSGVGSQHYESLQRPIGKLQSWSEKSAIRSSPVSMAGGSSLCIDGRIPLCMEAMLPSNNSTPAGRFPMWPALPTSEYYQPV